MWVRTVLLALGLGIVLASPYAQAQDQAGPAAPAIADPLTRDVYAAAKAQRPFEGLWGDSAKACRDQDGVDRLEITGNRLFWYETRCRASEIKAVVPNAWQLKLVCEGEGQRLRKVSRLSLPSPDRLVLDNAPVGPARRQSYVRCAPKR